MQGFYYNISVACWKGKSNQSFIEREREKDKERKRQGTKQSTRRERERTLHATFAVQAILPCTMFRAHMVFMVKLWEWIRPQC